MSTYVPLWTKSNFSFLEGASHPAELVDQAHVLGLPAIALTDRDGFYGAVRAHVRAKEIGQRVIHGTQLSVGMSLESARPLIVLPTDRPSYGRLCTLLSAGRARCLKGSSFNELDELLCSAQGLVVLCAHEDLLEPLREAFGDRLYALCVRHQHDADMSHEDGLRSMATRLGVLPVGTVETLYHTAARRPLQDILTCIRHGCTLAEAGDRIRQNAEHALKTPTQMRALFDDDPACLSRTLEVAQRCQFDLSQLRYVYPTEDMPSSKNVKQWLAEKTYEGAHVRYGHIIPDDVKAQLERELALINELDYGGYFLTMWEIVRYCREQEILCQGRGSAANSIVCYCLGITAIDPVRMDLLFERFLSRERAEPPDIDLDIEHQRREEVIQWVYQRYGRRRAAMVANVIRYRSRSAVRDVGKVLEIPQTALDRISKLLGHHDSGFDASLLEYAGLDPTTPVHAHLLERCHEIADFPRHLSIHPGGFLLGHEPVDTLVPIEPATMEERTVIQWDKYDVEDLGLFKVDLLGLGALSMVRGCFDLLREHEDVDLTMATVPQEDRSTYDMISAGNTLGTFQIESRAQMAMLPRLRPQTFYDLVIEVALVRPGPIQGDMVHPYLRRRQGKEPAEYPHPALERALSKTLGVPIFQEQVMKLAVLVADYTPGEADQLRRDMAAWRSSGRIEQHREILLSRMVANGIPQEFAERVFSQIRGFGEYGFPESHAASFALIAYITSWLRCHHHAVFTCGLLNAQPMGFYSPGTIVEDAKHHGVKVLPVDVMASAWDCTLERQGGKLCVRIGFRLVNGLGSRQKDKIEAALSNGLFHGAEDFVRRTGFEQKEIHKLAESGAFSGLGIERRDAVWDLSGFASTMGDSLDLPDMSPAMRFAKLTRDEAIAWDYRTKRHSTHGHPIECIRPQLRTLNVPTASVLNKRKNGNRTNYVGMVICRQRPGSASGVTFYTLEDETGIVNIVVWKDVFERHAIIAKTSVLMGVSGEVQREDGVVHFMATALWDPRSKFGKSRFESDGVTVRSFH